MNINIPQLKDLELVNRRTQIESGVAMESFGETVRRILPTMKASIHSYAETVKTNLAALTRNSHKFDPRAYDELANLMGRHEYTSTMELRFYVPEGFRGNIVKYAALLEKIQLHSNKVLGEVLTPYNVYLSKLLSDKNAPADTRLQLIELQKLKADREALTLALEHYFPKGNTGAAIKVGEAIERKQDWQELGSSLRVLATNFDPNLASKVSQAVQHCSELLDALNESGHEGGLDSISAQQLRSLGDSTLEVAKEVSFFSIVNYQVNTLLAVMVQNGEFLKKALQK